MALYGQQDNGRVRSSQTTTLVQKDRALDVELAEWQNVYSYASKRTKVSPADSAYNAQAQACDG